MTTLEDLIAFLRTLPIDDGIAGITDWELTDDGARCYTLVTTVMFTVPDGRPPPWPRLTIEAPP